MLTTLLGFMAILSSWNAIHDRLKEYYAFFLLLQTAMLGVFMALDFLLFFVFWEPCWCPCTSSSPSGAASAARLCGHQVHDLHADRQRADVPGHPDPVLPALHAVPAYSFDIADLMRTQVPPACSGGSSGPSSWASR
jgi:hypothetical protein